MCFRSVTLVVEVSYGLSAPSHVRKAMDVDTRVGYTSPVKASSAAKASSFALKSINKETFIYNK